MVIVVAGAALGGGPEEFELAQDARRVPLVLRAPKYVRMLLWMEKVAHLAAGYDGNFDTGSKCGMCDANTDTLAGHPHLSRHYPECELDAELTALGLDTLGKRDEARAKLVAMGLGFRLPGPYGRGPG